MAEKEITNIKDNITVLNPYNPLNSEEFTQIDHLFLTNFSAKTYTDKNKCSINSTITFPFNIKRQFNISKNIDKLTNVHANTQYKEKQFFLLEDQIDPEYWGLIEQKEIKQQLILKGNNKDKKELIDEINHLSIINKFYEDIQTSTDNLFFKKNNEKTHLETIHPIDKPIKKLSDYEQEMYQELKRMYLVQKKQESSTYTHLEAIPYPKKLELQKLEYQKQDREYLDSFIDLCKLNTNISKKRKEMPVFSHVHFYVGFKRNYFSKADKLKHLKCPNIKEETLLIKDLIYKYEDIYYLKNDDHKLIFSEETQSYTYVEDEQTEDEETSE